VIWINNAGRDPFEKAQRHIRLESQVVQSQHGSDASRFLSLAKLYGPLDHCTVKARRSILSIKMRGLH